MNKHTLILLAATTSLCLGTPAVLASDTDAHADHHQHGIVINGDNGIRIRHGDVIIENDDGGIARITRDGTLVVNDKTVPVSDRQKLKLLEYANTAKDLENQGMRLGMDAADFALDVVGDVFAALLSGDDEDAIEKNANARAREFKHRALPICKDVQSLKRIQDELAAGLTAFKPYAVIDGKDADDCEKDINSDD